MSALFVEETSPAKIILIVIIMSEFKETGDALRKRVTTPAPLQTTYLG